MYFPLYLSAAATASQIAADAVATSWNAKWALFLSGPLYTAINQSMLGIALVFFTLSSVKTLSEWLVSNNDANFLRLFAPIFIIIFLINNGQLAQTSVLTIRDVGNTITKSIVVKAQYGQQLTDRFDGMTVEQSALNRIKSHMSRCANEIAGSPAQGACMDSLEVLIKAEQVAGNIKDPGMLGKMAGYLSTWASEKATAISNGAALGNAVGDVPGAALGAIIGGATSLMGGMVDDIAGLALDPITAIISLILLTITAAVQHMTEASLLLTALITPMFLTAALLPNGSKSIITLLTAFWSIINFKICYTIVVILVNSLITGSDRNSLIILGLCTAIFSPILAGILAAGAGMGFAKAASSAAGQVGAFAGNTAMSVATGGTSTAAQAVAGIASNFIKK